MLRLCFLAGRLQAYFGCASSSGLRSCQENEPSLNLPMAHLEPFRFSWSGRAKETPLLWMSSR